MAELQELIDRWNTDEGRPFKGSLIDWDSYGGDGQEPPENLGCMCAQGQVLHVVAGWEPERIRDTDQAKADKEVAKLLNISTAHAILLRQVNDSIDGAPSIVLTDPGKVLGDQWSKLLDFWWVMDQLDAAKWREVATAWDAAWNAAWDAARDAAGAAAWDAARDAAWDAAGAAAGAAAWEIQGGEIYRNAGRPFFFLPMFGFQTPDDIPVRPANYGEAGHEG